MRSNAIEPFNTPSRLFTAKKETFLKTLWEKEKMLGTSIFSFSHNVFCPYQNKFQIYSRIYFVVCKFFQFGPVSSLLCGKELTRQQILGSSKLKEFADDNLKFEENGRKLFKPTENTVGKGEIARYEQFSFSHRVFKRHVSQGRQKVSLCVNGLNSTRIKKWLNVIPTLKGLTVVLT